jgi:hypothetical protein
MAYDATDRKKEAMVALERSDAAIEHMANEFLRDEGPQRPTPWFDFIELLQVHREATTALTGQAPAIPAQLEQLRRQSIQQLED